MISKSSAEVHYKEETRKTTGFEIFAADWYLDYYRFLRKLYLPCDIYWKISSLKFMML